MSWGDPWTTPWSGGPEEIVDHVESGQARLYEQFKLADPVSGQHLFGLEILLGEIQALETAANDLKSYMAISTAQGTQLDRIGAEVNQARLGLSDESYRCVLGVKIRALYSSGRALDFLEVANGLVKDDRAVTVEEIFPARVCVVIEDLTAAEVALFAPLLALVPAAGVGGCLFTYDTTAVLSFADVDSTPGIEVSGWYSDADGTPGIEGAGWADVTEL